MKKIIFVLLLAIGVSGVASAQDDNAPAPFRKKYRNISFSSQKMSFGDASFSDASNFGFGFTTGRSYIVHPRPIAGMLRLGIDATWFDINYGNWNQKLADKKWHIHKLDIGLGVGPGIHVNPVSKLGIHAYFRFNPTFTAMFTTIDGLGINGGYASYFTTGGAVSWGVISLGVEARFGGGRYHSFKAGGDGEEEGEEGSINDFFATSKIKHKIKGMRAYVSFRF